MKSSSKKIDKMLLTRILYGVDGVVCTADCMWKAMTGNTCAASFDWRCSGICKSVERMMGVHERCGEDKNAIWSGRFSQ